MNDKLKGMTEEELLAKIIGKGMCTQKSRAIARSMLKKERISNINNFSINDLQGMYELNRETAEIIHYVYEIHKRIVMDTIKSKTKINSPDKAFLEIMRFDYNRNQEEFYLICMDARSNVISCKKIFIGTPTAIILSQATIYKYALEENAQKIIVAHNHPSNELSPSIEDIETTIKLLEIGKLMDIPLLDHIIFNEIEYNSLAETTDIFN